MYYISCIMAKFTLCYMLYAVCYMNRAHSIFQRYFSTSSK